MEETRTRVALIYGGKSSEHLVSTQTAAGVLEALDETRYHVTHIRIDTEGTWSIAESHDARGQIIPGPGIDDPGSELLFAPVARDVALQSIDVAMPLLHGPWGEDGTIQGLFELMGIPYVGSGVLASAVGMDKEYMKALLRAAGLPQLPYAVLPSSQAQLEEVAEQVAHLGYPLFVKPARGGSSIGISRVDNADQLPQAIEAARAYDPKVVIESAAVGSREIECGILEASTGDLATSRPGEIVVQEQTFYDFEAKYASSQTDLEVPAHIPSEVEREIHVLALRTFRAIGAEGLSRVDFFLMPDGKLFVNEINTMPGFTPSSVFPKLWENSGLSYKNLIDVLIQNALGRPKGLR